MKQRGYDDYGNQGAGMRNPGNNNNRQYRSGTANSTMKRRTVSKKQKKKELLHALLPPIIAIFLILIVVAVALGSGMLDSLKYSSQKADMYSYYNISDDDRAVIVRDGEITDETVPVFDGQPYVLLNDVNDEFNDRFYYDVESDSYLYTRADSIDSAKAAPGSITYMGGTRTVDYSPFVVKDEDTYIALEYLKLYKNLLIDQLNFCRQNQDTIVSKANKLYGMVKKKNTSGMLKRRCLKWEKLEEILDRFKP